MNAIAIELFGCAGGMAEGFRRAGIAFELVVDADPDACASYETNLGHAPVRMDIRDLVRLAQVGSLSASCWLLVADPPCTPWSSGGKRKGLDDPRDCMRPTVELIRLLQPDCYLIGNVPGLQYESNAKALTETIGTLAQAGYCTADACVFDAADFGVPQHRIRPFWFGHRRGTPCITWPSPTHERPTLGAKLPGTELIPWVTAGAALADIPDAELGRRCRVRDHGKAHPNAVEPDAPARTQNSNPEGCSVLRVRRTHTTPDRDGLARVVDTSAGRSANVLTGWLAERPSLTISTDERLGTPGHNRAGDEDAKSYYDEAVVLSERARARLQGFPDGWTFVGKTKKSRNAQIGMAMPPPLAHAVAEAIVAWRNETSCEAGET